MGALQVVIGLYATVLPFAVLAAWLAVALWDLSNQIRDGEVGRPVAVGWSLIVLVVPVFGVVAYLLGAAAIPRWLAWTYLAGGVLSYLVVLVLTGSLGAAG
ncbi:MAG: PLDc N-terminal domain-containing protein [Nitriliruptoraceae bacterium]